MPPAESSPNTQPLLSGSPQGPRGAGDTYPPFHPLPHEWIFGAFLVVTWGRLVIQAGAASPYALLFLGCILGAIGVCAWAHRRPDKLRWRVRLLYFPAVVGVTFYALGPVVRALTLQRFDALLLAWDNALFGATPAVSYQAWSHPLFNDLLMVGYLFFFIQLVGVPGAYCVRDLARFRKCIVGLFVMYGIGFLFYTLMPAGGPHRWMTFDVPLSGVFVLPATLDAVNAGSNGVDVFPSLHVSMSVYLLAFDWWHARRRFWLCLGPCVLLWPSTVLLRFHYFVDVIGGLVLAGLGVWAAMWFERRHGSDGLPLAGDAPKLPAA